MSETKIIRTKTKSKEDVKNNPAITPEARERTMISLAMDAAEKSLRDGTASSQVITHFLKLATVEKEVELELLKAKKELAKAQVDKIKSDKKSEETYANAIRAFSEYSGREVDDDDEY